MPKNAKTLLISCIVAILGLLSLQVYWIIKYYRITQYNFEKEVNLAFDDAIKKEFSLRCDTVQMAIENRLLDTNYFRISAKLNEKKDTYIYTITNVKNPSDRLNSSFSLSNINRPLSKDDDTTRKQLAKNFALMIRSEDLENHIVYYRLQDLGRYTVDQNSKFQFDTARLRKVFNSYLAKKQITVPYQFITRVEDSLTSESKLKDSLRHHYKVVTKALPTYKYDNKMDYVRAGFINPAGYIVANMGVIFFSSFILVLVIAGLLVFILKTLFKEKRLSAIKDDFISNITHEFKTPIATISVAAESLVNECEDYSAKQKRYLSYIKNETEKLSMLVDQVLQLSVFEASNIKLKKEQIAIDEVIPQLIQVHELSARKAVHFQFSPTSGQTISADKTQFIHALNNVIDNAIKYSKDIAEIRISVLENDDFLIITTEDQGIGMEDHELQMVFEKFYRVAKGNHHLVKGYGLGLNYVKQIMEAHGGWCRVESKPNIGTTLTLAWPK